MATKDSYERFAAKHPGSSLPEKSIEERMALSPEVRQRTREIYQEMEQLAGAPDKKLGELLESDDPETLLFAIAALMRQAIDLRGWKPEKSEQYLKELGKLVARGRENLANKTELNAAMEEIIGLPDRELDAAHGREEKGGTLVKPSLPRRKPPPGLWPDNV